MYSGGGGQFAGIAFRVSVSAIGCFGFRLVVHWSHISMCIYNFISFYHFLTTKCIEMSLENFCVHIL